MSGEGYKYSIADILVAGEIAEDIVLSDKDRETLGEFHSVVGELQEEFGGAEKITWEQEEWTYEEAFNRVPGAKELIMTVEPLADKILRAGRDE